MSQTEQLAELAHLVRANHHVALFIVGWFAVQLAEDELKDLLVAARDVSVNTSGNTHYQAYRERWGRIPDPLN